MEKGASASAVFDRYFERHQGRILRDVPLSRWSHALCGGPARWLMPVYSADMLTDVIGLATAANVSYRVLGGLSNVLISDEGFDGLAILNRADQFQISPEKTADGLTLVRCETGIPLLRFVTLCAEAGLSGLEWACGIPGTLGGAIYGAAGAFGGEIRESLRSVRLLSPDGARVETLSNAELSFAYRSSALKRGEKRGALLDVEFALRAAQAETVIADMKEIQRTRKEIHPAGMGSLGSVFKNPPGFHAGELIERVGLKGKRLGLVQISEKHGNFFVTAPGAKSADYAALIRLAQEEVYARTGVRLETEIEMIGGKS